MIVVHRTQRFIYVNLNMTFSLRSLCSLWTIIRTFALLIPDRDFFHLFVNTDEGDAGSEVGVVIVVWFNHADAVGDRGVSLFERGDYEFKNSTVFYRSFELDLIHANS